jgi:hypothetical protein
MTVKYFNTSQISLSKLNMKRVYNEFFHKNYGTFKEINI